MPTLQATAARPTTTKTLIYAISFAFSFLFMEYVSIGSVFGNVNSSASKEYYSDYNTNINNSQSSLSSHTSLAPVSLPSSLVDKEEQYVIASKKLNKDDLKLDYVSKQLYKLQSLLNQYKTDTKNLQLKLHDLQNTYNTVFKNIPTESKNIKKDMDHRQAYEVQGFADICVYEIYLLLDQILTNLYISNESGEIIYTCNVIRNKSPTDQNTHIEYVVDTSPNDKYIIAFVYVHLKCFIDVFGCNQGCISIITLNSELHLLLNICIQPMRDDEFKRVVLPAPTYNVFMGRQRDVCKCDGTFQYNGNEYAIVKCILVHHLQMNMLYVHQCHQIMHILWLLYVGMFDCIEGGSFISVLHFEINLVTTAAIDPNVIIDREHVIYDGCKCGGSLNYGVVSVSGMILRNLKNAQYIILVDLFAIKLSKLTNGLIVAQIVFIMSDVMVYCFYDIRNT